MVCRKASRWTTFWLLMAISFSTGAVLSAPLCITLQSEWFVWLVSIGINGILGMAFTYVYIRKSKNKKELFMLSPEDVVIDIITCMDKQRTEFPNDNEVTLTMSTEKGDFYLSYAAYKSILIGDKLAYVNIFGIDIAYPLKCWEIEGVIER